MMVLFFIFDFPQVSVLLIFFKYDFLLFIYSLLLLSLYIFFHV